MKALSDASKSLMVDSFPAVPQSQSRVSFHSLRGYVSFESIGYGRSTEVVRGYGRSTEVAKGYGRSTEVVYTEVGFYIQTMVGERRETDEC